MIGTLQKGGLQRSQIQWWAVNSKEVEGAWAITLKEISGKDKELFSFFYGSGEALR